MALTQVGLRPDTFFARVCRVGTSLALPLLLLAGCLANAQEQTASTTSTGARTVAFVGVSVVPLTSDVVLPNQTVVVDDGKIAAIGEAGRVSVPVGTQVIDGHGRYLMPGLSDMHAHIFRQPAEDALFLYLANGVTTIRNMAGNPRFLTLKRQVATGELPGPRIFTSSPMLMRGGLLPGVSVAADTPAQADAHVAAFKQAGYDSIKLHTPIAAEVFTAAIAAGLRHDIPVEGHVPEDVGVSKAIKAGLSSIEHFSSYSSTAVDAGLERLTVESGVWNCPTLIVMWTNLNQDKLMAAPFEEIRYMRQADAMANAERRARNPKPANNINVSGFQKLLKRLHDTGAKLMVGTDTGTFMLVPGFSLHRELGLWVEAGLRPYDVLRAATVAPADYLGIAGEAGTIETGKRADLVLLAANPLIDIKNASRIEGVMSAGRYTDKAEIDRRLAEMAARVAAAP